MTRKFLFGLFQISGFLGELLKGRARIRPRRVVCDWPHNEHRRQFLVLGDVRLREDEIFIKIGRDTLPLSQCPQVRFFEQLDEGLEPSETSYFKLVASLDYQVNISEWFQDKKILWSTFSPDSENFSPVAVKTNRKTFIVEDGAHRLALRQLRGYNVHDVAISFWFVG